MPILQSLEITAKTAGNVIIEDAILKVRAGVERGESFVEPLKATEVFPHMVGQMVGVGEQTGALDAMLGKIADFYEDEVDSAIADLLAMIEPALIAFLGVTIGGIVISMYLPLFTLIGKLRAVRSKTSENQSITDKGNRKTGCLSFLDLNYFGFPMILSLITFNDIGSTLSKTL